jgi:hypothetical protein
MSLAEYSKGLQRTLAGDFGEEWVEATAAGCGILHGREHTLDLIKADVRLTMRGEFGRTLNPSVLIQVKTTVDLRQDGPDGWAYDLDVETYDVLRQTNHQTRRILAVIGLSSDRRTVEVLPEGTLLIGQAAWVSIEGHGPTANASTEVVHLPRVNTLDKDGFEEMIKTYGVPRSSQVPELDEWGDRV